MDNLRNPAPPIPPALYYQGVIDGSSPTDLTNHPSFDENPDWAPDGSRILFKSTRSATSFYVMNTEGTGQTALSSAPTTRRCSR